jgi:hypothetical protein
MFIVTKSRHFRSRRIEERRGALERPDAGIPVGDARVSRPPVEFVAQRFRIVRH